MKIKLTSFYGDRTPGDIIECDDKEGARVISVGGAVATDEEPTATKPRKP